MDLSALKYLKNIVSPGFLCNFHSDLFNTCRYSELAYYFEFLNLFMPTVSSIELPAYEHAKVLCLQTVCWLPGEPSLPIGYLLIDTLTIT